MLGMNFTRRRPSPWASKRASSDWLNDVRFDGKKIDDLSHGEATEALRQSLTMLRGLAVATANQRRNRS